MPDFRITIDLKDVGPGDVDNLAEQIMLQYGDDYDAVNGDFTVVASQREGSNYFPRDPGDDPL